MKKTGEMLRKAREGKGLSMTEIALSLKINSKILTSIEDGDLTKLPAKTFLRGFVQSYANYLKMDTDEVMAVFAEEMGSTKPKPLIIEEAAPPAELSDVTPKQPEPGPAVVSAPTSVRPESPAKEHLAGLEESSQSKTILFSGIAIVLLVLIFGTVKIIERYQKESVVPETVQIAAPISTETPLTSEAGKPSVDVPPPLDAAPTVVMPPNQPTPPVSVTTAPVKAEAPRTETPPPAPVEKKIEEKPKTADVKKSDGDKSSSETKKEEKKAEANHADEKKNASATETKPAEKKPRSLELIVEAMDQVDIEYSTLSGATQKVHLGPDQFHTIKSTNGLKLNVSNGGAVNLILNGRDLGAPGDLGKPAKLTY